MTKFDNLTIVFGRELPMDVYGSCMIFSSRRDAEDYPGICVQVCEPIETFAVYKYDADDNLINAEWDDIEFNQAQHIGRNDNLRWRKLSA